MARILAIAASMLIRSDELKQHRYTVDGIHTNAAGAEINGQRLCESINGLLR